MSDRISVSVHAHDPLSSAGMASQLRGRAEIALLDDGTAAPDAVALVVVDDVDDEAVRTVSAIRSAGCARVVVVATRLDDRGLLSAVEAGACALLRRSDALPDKLVQTVSRAAAGDGTVPPDLLGRLLEQIGLLQRQVLAPRGLTFSGLSEREIEVLRLISEGLDTTEVAGRLCYSERTVKNVLHDVTTRLRLRNRTHAVAYAMRNGLI
jgi:DNA-binding NarL/FixJ family response regulator